MRPTALVGTLAALSAAVIVRAQAPAPPPPAAPGLPFPWAYVVTTNPVPGLDDPTPRHIAGTTRTFTQAQISNGLSPADWFPEDHPPMPKVVASSTDTKARACGLCHYPNGRGRPENAPIAGLPFDYIVQQLKDFGADRRLSSDDRKDPTKEMGRIVRALTESDITEVATYFSSMKPAPWVKLVEQSEIPKVVLASSMYQPVGDGTSEPIGNRIVEMPVNAQATLYRDPHSGFIAYAPPGSVGRGKALVTTGGKGKTIMCANCHGQDLHGIGPFPGLAGRSPSYLARQLWDLKSGARHGEWSALMKPVVAKLTEADIMDIVAYLASRTP